MDPNSNAFPGRTPGKKLLRVKVDDVDPKLVPEGVYRCRCTDIVEETSKANNPMWTWDFVIVGGEQDGKELKMWTALTDKALWKLRDVMEGLQIPKDANSEYVFDPEDVMKMDLIVQVEVEEYKGQDKSTIAAIFAASHPDAPEVTDKGPAPYRPDGPQTPGF